METLLAPLQNADRICRQADAHFENAAQFENRCQTLLMQLRKTKRKWIILGVVIWIAVGTLGGVFSSIPTFGRILQAVCSLTGIAGGVYIGVTGYRREKFSAQSEISGLTERARTERETGREILDRNGGYLAFLPVEYRNCAATSYLVRMVASGRVRTLGEALDRYDAQLHLWKVEAANANLVAQQQAQTAHLKSIRTSSKVSAAANVTNTLFNIASRL